ncbi:MAG: B12-binding domain-containing radical SAM protein [Candidatus Scalindua sp.]|nr:B12-binding domain-containing radical SAM protein [Candidatus Scalindua sp.]
MKDNIKTLLLRLPQNLDNVHEITNILHPYSLAIISGFLKYHKKDVTLFDAAVYRLEQDAILEYVKELNPQILGLSIMSQHLFYTIQFLKEIKTLMPEIVVVVGGPHVCADYDNLMGNNKEIDIAVIGEGEQTMLEIIESIQGGNSLDTIKGIAHRVRGETKITSVREYIANLDLLPFADWGSLPMEKYSDAITVKKNYGGIMASRGCPYACTFCGARTALGVKARMRSPGNILEEINLLYNKFHVRQILFHDSTFNLDNLWLSEICEGILEMNKHLIWGCNVRTERLDREVLKLMKRSGCIRAFVGVESADNRVLKRMKKGTTIEKIEKGIRLLEEVGITTDCGFILGMPGETEDSIKNTIEFAKRIKKGICTFSLASPFPGSEFYEIAQEEGFKVKDWSKHDLYTMAYIPKDLTKEKLEFYYKFAVRSFYLRVSFILNQLLQIRSFRNLKIMMTAAYSIFFKRFVTFKR